MKKMLTMFLCCLPIIGQAALEPGTCDFARAQEQHYNNVTPQIIDNITTLLGYVANCPSKHILYTYQTSMPSADIDKKALINVFKRFTVKQCTEKGFAQYGWTVESRYYDMKMKMLFRFIAKAHNCEKKKQIKY